jgi:hypothetical protein
VPTGQQYSSTAVQATLQGTIGPAALAAVVDSVSGFPSTPFAVVADPGQGNQEVWDVTNVTGLTLTITRAVDGTTAQTHSAGAKIVHVGIGRDLREARTHIDASQQVHGLGPGSAVVGTLDSQTLSSKTLTQPIINGSGGLLTLPAGPTTLVGRDTTDTLTNKTLTAPVTTAISNSGGLATDTLTASGLLTGLDLTATGLTGATGASRYVGATAGGAPQSGTFAVGDYIVDRLGGAWVCTAAGTPGTWLPLVASKGPGFSVNAYTGGANRTASQAPFVASGSTSLTVGGGSGWTLATGITCNGIGYVSATLGDDGNGIGFLRVSQANTNMTTIAGEAFLSNGSGAGTILIRVNWQIHAW